ncbi:MAG: serine--tRNA ligase [Clostridiales bacterium]|nr:serine--tRNA ligase [Clostridiales bacterium]
MLDIKFVRDNPDIVKENIKKKFQDEKLPLVDQVIDLYNQALEAKQKAEALQQNRNVLSKQIGMLKGKAKKEPEQAAAYEAQAAKLQEQVVTESEEREALFAQEAELNAKVREIMLVIPNIIDPSVPIGPDDSCNVEVQRFGEPKVPDFPIPYHTDIMESFNGIDLTSARRVSGTGFYYLIGDVARLHEAVLAYARDFMIDRGFTYVIPPYMIRGEMVEGVMSFPEMDAMMYKIEDATNTDPKNSLYLIGTSEHSMIARFNGQIIPGDQLPLTLTSYSPCFRKEKGSHGLEERGVYRIHQFEKQEMIVICKPEDSMAWYEKMWRYSVDLFRSLDIPVRQLECCSGDLADLKVKSCDIEAWSPRQQKYFEVCSCSNLGDAQARRLGIRYTETVEFTDKKGRKKTKTNNVLAHTLNNTVVAPPRMLIAFLENNLQAGGTVVIPKVLQPYMGGRDRLQVANTYVPKQD